MKEMYEKKYKPFVLWAYFQFNKTTEDRILANLRKLPAIWTVQHRVGTVY